MQTSVHPVSVICVCGAGTMGSGIAQLAAMAGYRTIQFDVNTNMLEKSRALITKNLDWLVSKAKMNAGEKEACLKRIHFTSAIADCVADLVIEAIIENREAKTDLFSRLCTFNGPHTIFATNTSSISVTAIAQQTAFPERVAGMHFFNPAPLMKLVELVHTNHTGTQVMQTLRTVAEKMGKTAVECKDAPGFIVNRVARHYYLEAMQLVQYEQVQVETIDAVMEATGFKMGPFRLMDLIGMDINYSVSNIVWEALGKPERLTPSVIQKQKVEAGELGRKTGKGFYTYES